MARCQDCGEHSPDRASFCIVCGARLVAPAARARAPLYPSVGSTVHLRAPCNKPAAPLAGRLADRVDRPCYRQLLIPLVGLVFGMAVVIGVAQMIALQGLHSAGIWLVAVLIGGVLLAESAWVNGELWRGLR